MTSTDTGYDAGRDAHRIDDSRAFADWAEAVLPSRGILVAVLIPLALLKMVQVTLAPAVADEAYYWLWGQHLDWSYFDHPPLASWLMRGFGEVLGWNMVALRAFPLATFAASLWILHYWSHRLAPAGRGTDTFLAGVIAWLSIPAMMRFQSIAHQDHLLILTSMAAMHFFALFHLSLDRARPAWRFFYAACLCVGLAGLTKYTGVFLGAGFAAWVFATARGRALLRHAHVWLGGALAAAMQAPVLYWNIAHDWPSIRYNLSDRIGQTYGTGFLDNFYHLALTTLVMLSPVALFAICRFAAGNGPLRTPFQPVGRWVLAISTAVFVALCASNTVLYYWNLVAYLAAMPMIVFFIRTRMEFAIHVVSGLSLGVWVVMLHAIYPTYKHSGEDMRDNDISYGLSEIAAIVEEEEARLGADFVLTTDYRTASLLSFTTGRMDIEKIGLRNDQFDFWFDPAAHKGEDALVLADDFLPEDELVTQVFETVTPVREFTIRRFGFPMHTYRLSFAQNYSGEGPH